MPERLIDAEKLINRAVMVEALDGNGCPYEFLAVPLITVENSPTIEAKPVVHAHWEEAREGLHVCSNCKVKSSLISDEYDYMENLSDYCPWCGAQMDEVTE